MLENQTEVNKINPHKLRNSFIFTTVFCLFIAFLTYTVWQGDFYIHLLLSYGYGYSAVLSGFTLQRKIPNLRNLVSNFIALSFSLIIGSLNAAFWLKRYDDFATIESLKPVVLLGVVFTATCFYFFHASEQKILADKALEVAKRKQSEQEKALILSQLNQLQSQIEPHFLFNTLANIQVLIELDQKKASIMLLKLTELLRGTLSVSRSPFTNLEQETELLSAYLDIQKIRLDERLHYQIDNQVDDNISLPPFLIQPLVENAIQHGIEPTNEGGNLLITFKIKAEKLVIEIVDSGVGLQEKSNSKGNGLSLENIKQRLISLFEGEAGLSIIENQQGGVSSTLSISLAQLKKLPGA